MSTKRSSIKGAAKKPTRPKKGMSKTASKDAASTGRNPSPSGASKKAPTGVKIMNYGGAGPMSQLLSGEGQGEQLAANLMKSSKSVKGLEGKLSTEKAQRAETGTSDVTAGAEALSETAATAASSAPEAEGLAWSEKRSFSPMNLLSAATQFGLGLPRTLRRAVASFKELKVAVARGLKDMDPRLQMMMAKATHGIAHLPTAAAAPGEVSVVAKVTDPAEWENISEVRLGMHIGVERGTGLHVVTGRIPLLRVGEVKSHPSVMSLKAAQLLHPTLSATVQNTRCSPVLLPAGHQTDGGKGVVVGIVDFGCDFAHKNFRDANGRTRLEIIWDQSQPGAPGHGMPYGKLYSPGEINEALKKQDPYGALGYGPAADTPKQTGAHGTHVMDIAAGNGGGSGIAGCAPKASLVFVDLSTNDLPAISNQDVVYKSFGDSVRLLEAIRFIFDKAGDRPCVVNVSLGTNGGPHDGSTPVEKGIDALVRERPNRAVVIAASNSYADGIHAMGTVPANGHHDLGWVMTVAGRPAEMELWLPGNAKAGVELLSEAGDSLGIIEPGDTREYLDDNGDISVFMANRLKDPNNGDNQISIFVAGASEAATWTVRLHARGGQNAPFHAWIERYDAAQSKFNGALDNSHTLGSISCGKDSIVVGSYDGHKEGVPLSWFSSAGPTRDGRHKPEISAPGHGVYAAWSRTGTKTVLKNGTSMASPAVCGIIALVLAEAVKNGVELSIDDLKGLLERHARKTPETVPGWHPRYGHGGIDAAAMLADAALQIPVG